MKKYIFFICSTILCTNFLSAQLKEKVVSFTRSLQNLKKFISQSGDLPAIDEQTIGFALFYIFDGTLDTPEKLKDFLHTQKNYKITDEQAQKLFSKWKSEIEKKQLSKLLPPNEIVLAIENIKSGVIKSPVELQNSLKAIGYLVTLEQAQQLYTELSLPTELPPPPLRPITARDAFHEIELGLKRIGEQPIDYKTPEGISKYLTSRGYIVTPELLKEVKKLIATEPMEEVAKIPTKPKTPIKPLGEKAAQEQAEAIAAVKKAIDVDRKVFGDVGAIIRYLKSITKYPTDFTTNLPEAKFREKLKDFVPKKD